jgi:cardiolipin synthase (CMP-forming)
VYKSQKFIDQRSVPLIWTYANQLTILRIVLVPCFVMLLVGGHPKSAAVIFALAGFTDGLDGFLARKLQQKTALGSYLDPIADKLLLTAAFITLAVPTLPLALHIPIWLTVLTISRDFLISVTVLVIYLRTHHTQFPPSILGKGATAAQLLTVAACLLGNFESGIAAAVFPFAQYLTLAFTVASGLHYSYRSITIVASYQTAGNGNQRNQNTRS